LRRQKPRTVSCSSSLFLSELSFPIGFDLE
jgi:hypothetical protein